MPEATPDTTMDGPQRAAAEESPPVTIQREHDAAELVAARREIESLRAQQRSQAACLDDVIAADELSRQQQAAMHEKLTSERARRLAAEEACSSAEAACSRLAGQLEAEREKSARLGRGLLFKGKFTWPLQNEAEPSVSICIHLLVQSLR